PELLWLYSLGITLYWVHDTSDGCSRTYQLIDATVPVVTQLVSASRLPVLRKSLADLIKVIDLLSAPATCPGGTAAVSPLPSPDRPGGACRSGLVTARRVRTRAASSPCSRRPAPPM